MPHRTVPPFRADHVGSLLRPPELLLARDEHAAGRITDQQLREMEDSAIADVVRLQEEAGLQSATDGEYRRAMWHTDFVNRLGGIREGGVAGIVTGHKADGQEVTYEGHATEVTGKVHLTETIFGDHFSFLASAVTTATPKLTIPSPSMVTFRADLSASGYSDPEQFRTDVAAAYAEEIRRLAALGCSYLQLDDTVFAFLNDPRWRQNAGALGMDPAHQHEINVRVVNQALAGRPDGLTVTVHMCRGNYRSAWFTSGGYDYVAGAVFGGLAVDGFFLEYDDERSGSFEPLRFVPDDKLVVLGLITTKTPALESKDDLKRRVGEATRYVPLERLCLSPQCGFASTVEGNALTRDQMRAKLELAVQTATEIWG
ncbi:MAG TPA: 5-methyltetrahydropteroyltriglutamate--homocysteine S-methyltransferase [Actinobacteria bacterium]|nr:5-methyltetrahydropteroyltriglutamate--homocysteine S-methyltransferase [Actinomycetota bacterium]